MICWTDKKAEENFKNYSDQLFRLLQHVRLPLAKPQFLFDIVQAEPLIKQNRYSLWSSPVFRPFAPIFDEEGNQNWLKAKSCVMFEMAEAQRSISKIRSVQPTIFWNTANSWKQTGPNPARIDSILWSRIYCTLVHPKLTVP